MSASRLSRHSRDRNSEKPITPLEKQTETGNAINKRAAVAMEIKYQWPAVCWWKMPSDEGFSVIGLKTQILSVFQIGLRELGEPTVGKILEPSLKGGQTGSGH